jgi:hypothetical protein
LEFFSVARYQGEGRVKRERRIAEEIANELHRALGPIMPEDLGENSEVVERVFGDAFDRHHVVSESAGARVLGYVPAELARLNFKYAELQLRLDAAMRPTIRAGATSRTLTAMRL